MNRAIPPNLIHNLLNKNILDTKCYLLCFLDFNGPVKIGVGGCCGVFHPVKTIMNALSVIGWNTIYFSFEWLVVRLGSPAHSSSELSSLCTRVWRRAIHFFLFPIRFASFEDKQE